MTRLSPLLLAGLLAGLACTPTPPPSTAPTSSQTTAPAATDGATDTATAPASDTTTPAPSKEGPVGAMCGGIAGFGCAVGLYCDFALDAHCGSADQAGTCKPKPEMCTEQYDPVCGCDDKTYGNACIAARDGISVAAKGECSPATPPPLTEGQLCGTRGVPGECSEGLYCKYKSACGATDSGGSCVVKPRACTRIYKPVCGCDGKTYPSDCVAASEGVDVEHAGACAK